MFSMCCLFFIFWVKLIVILGSAIQVLGLLWLFGDIYSSTLSFDCFVVLHLMCFLWVLGFFKPLLEFLGGNDDDQRGICKMWNDIHAFIWLLCFQKEKKNFMHDIGLYLRWSFYFLVYGILRYHLVELA